MEEDRFRQRSKLYIFCMICLLFSLILIAFDAYILPYCLWDLHYDVPTFIIFWIEYIKEYYNYTDKMAKIILLSGFSLATIITGIVCFFASNKIENDICHVESRTFFQQDRLEHDLKETVSLSLQVVVVILLVIGAVFFVEWLIAPVQEFT
jgi:hypothetical protein